MAFKALQQKRQFVTGKYIVGIDPSKHKHQAAVIDTNGIQTGKAFTFKKTYQGYHHDLWQRLQQIIPSEEHENIVFAIETVPTRRVGVNLRSENFITCRPYGTLKLFCLT